MNELARIVHDLVAGQEPRADGLAGLSPQARAALEDVRFLLRYAAETTVAGPVASACIRGPLHFVSERRASNPVFFAMAN